jgi:hypothetical protein
VLVRPLVILGVVDCHRPCPFVHQLQRVVEVGQLVTIVVVPALLLKAEVLGL